MRKKCAVTGAQFEVSPADLEFYRTLSAPPPSLSPLERQRRRLSFRNFRNLYHRTCSATGKRIISMYGEGTAFPVYANEHWWSDAWDPKDYGVGYDRSKGFFAQYKELSDRVPRYGIMNVNAEECEFSNMVLSSRSCYLVFGCVRSEDCYFGHIVWDSSNCLDTLYAYLCQWCSHSLDIVRCYDVHYSQECSDCQECYFLFDCAACQNCFGCINLRNARYCIFNEQYTKEGYFRKLAELFPLDESKIAEIREFLAAERAAQATVPDAFEVASEDVSGNHIYESAALRYCFDAKRCETSAYCFTAFGVSNSMDISFTGASARFSLECLTMANTERTMFCHMLNSVGDACYSEFCASSSELFGCIGLRNSKYCILNKQYAKEEYHVLRSQIIADMTASGEWGEFFPANHSPFAYNESIAQEYMPLTREEALRRGLRWRDEAAYPPPPNDRAIVPRTAAEADNSVTAAVYYCTETGKPFKIIKAELDFCRRMNLPLSSLCPDRRHVQRMRMRADRSLRSASCAACKAAILTAHESAFAARILCRKCYRETLYGEAEND